MSGTKRGGKRAARTIKKRYGDDFYVMIGTRGGRAPHAWRPFQGDPVLARKANRLRRRREARMLRYELEHGEIRLDS